MGGRSAAGAGCCPTCEMRRAAWDATSLPSVGGMLLWPPGEVRSTCRDVYSCT
jgi:hypothetical protein